jgi:hypothetical protein
MVYANLLTCMLTLTVFYTNLLTCMWVLALFLIFVFILFGCYFPEDLLIWMCKFVLFFTGFQICIFVHSFDFSNLFPSKDACQYFWVEYDFHKVLFLICLSFWSISFLIIPTRFWTLSLSIFDPFFFLDYSKFGYFWSICGFNLFI